MAEAAAAAALHELGATLKKSGTTQLATLKLLGDLGLNEDEEALEADELAEIASVVEKADGEAGDRVKYEYAVGSMVRRWKLFLALHGFGEEQPTHEMVKLFVGFMYLYRQRPSKVGRQGLGDSMAEMAQYILAQVGGSARSAGTRSLADQLAACCAIVRLTSWLLAVRLCACRRCLRRWATRAGSG